MGCGEAGKLVSYRILPEVYNHSKDLLPAIMEIQHESSFKFEELKFIMAGIGPGSYTGIRVGASFAKGLAMGLNIPLGGFPSLDPYSPSCSGLFAVVSDAKYAGVYLRLGFKKDHYVEWESEPTAISWDDLTRRIKGVGIAVTPAIAALKDKWDLLCPEIKLEEATPDSKRLALECFQNYLEGKASSSWELPLLYLRKTQAELELST